MTRPNKGLQEDGRPAVVSCSVVQPQVMAVLPPPLNPERYASRIPAHKKAHRW